MCQSGTAETPVPLFSMGRKDVLRKHKRVPYAGGIRYKVGVL